jgi:hypothetical protein
MRVPGLLAVVAVAVVGATPIQHQQQPLQDTLIIPIEAILPDSAEKTAPRKLTGKFLQVTG